MVGVIAALEDERVDQPAVKTDTHTHPGLGVVGLLGADQVVELPVQVWHGEHRQYPGDRLVLGRLPLGGHPAGVAERTDVRIAKWPSKKRPRVINTMAVAYAHQIGTANN